MATLTRRVLSGSANGRPVGVVATSSPGTTLHALPTATNISDGVKLHVCNTATIWRTLTIEFGTTASEGQIIVTIPPREGLFAIKGALDWTGNAASGATIAAFGTATSGLAIFGAVTRRTD